MKKITAHKATLFHKPTLQGLSVILAVLLGACASGNSAKIDTVPVNVPVELPPGAANRSKAPTLTAIADPNLPRGTCGMVLWTLDVNRPIPIVRYISGSNGDVAIDGIPHDLARLSVGGSGAFGVFPVQTFAAGTGIRFEVELQFGQGFEGGTYLERGVVTVSQPDKPTLVIPVAGLAGCRGK